MNQRFSPLVLALLLVLAGMATVLGIWLMRPLLATQLGQAVLAAEDVGTGLAAIPTPEQTVAASVPAATATAPPTAVPTALPTATAMPTATPTPAYAPPQPAVALGGIRHVWQTWNNCGPATLAMNLSYFGRAIEQGEVGAALRRHEDDKNVGPDELAAYAREQGFAAEVRVNGSTMLLRTLLSNGIPVLIETWHEEDEGDGLGHYRLITGYDEAADHWIAYDTYDANDLISTEAPYAGIRIPYGDLDTLWRVFNRTYVLIYPPERSQQVAAILGGELDARSMWMAALLQAQAEAAEQPGDAFAWFNIGSSAMAQGDAGQAAAAFDRARELGLPWRMFWYQFGAFEAYQATARYGDVLALADATLAGTSSIEELHFWRGAALEALGNPDEARRAWQTAVALNPTYQPAIDALAALR